MKYRREMAPTVRETVDFMKKLLEFAEEMSFFTITFDVTAPNEDIEAHFYENADKTDWEGKPLSQEEIDKSVEEIVNRFRNSEGYNPDGPSTLKMSQCVTLQSINFADILSLVAGEKENLPKNYAYAGNLQLMDYKEIDRKIG